MNSHHRKRSPRRGSALVVTMLYLMLFSALAVAFCAGSMMSMQSAVDDRQSADALGAAESGMQWARFQLIAVQITDATTRDALKAAMDRALQPAARDFLPLDRESTLCFRTWVSEQRDSLRLYVTGRAGTNHLERTISMQLRLAGGHVLAMPQTYQEGAP